MSTNAKLERVLERVEPGRRETMRKLLVTAIYTAPVVASFSLASMADAQVQCANQTCVPVQVPATSGGTLATIAALLGAAGAFLLRRRRGG